MANIPFQKRGLTFWSYWHERHRWCKSSGQHRCALPSGFLASEGTTASSKSKWHGSFSIAALYMVWMVSHFFNNLFRMKHLLGKKSWHWSFAADLDTLEASMLLRSHGVIPCMWHAGWVISEITGESSGARREDLQWCLQLLLLFRYACLWTCRTPESAVCSPHFTFQTGLPSTIFSFFNNS